MQFGGEGVGIATSAFAGRPRNCDPACAPCQPPPVCMKRLLGRDLQGPPELCVLYDIVLLPSECLGPPSIEGEESLRCARSGMHRPARCARRCRLPIATRARQHRQNEGLFPVKGPQGVYCTAAHSAWARQPSKGGDWRPLENRLSGGADGLPAPRFLCMWIRTHGPRLMSYACVWFGHAGSDSGHSLPDFYDVCIVFLLSVLLFSFRLNSTILIA